MFAELNYSIGHYPWTQSSHVPTHRVHATPQIADALAVAPLQPYLRPTERPLSTGRRCTGLRVRDRSR
jgi:hypothetical protein